MQEIAVSRMLDKQAPVAGGPSVSFYYKPERDGDIKARIKAIADKRSGPYPGARYSESDWARRLVLAILEQEERELDLKRPATGKRRKTA